MAKLPRLAVTLGEPAGIGPELAVHLAHSDLAADLVMIGDRGLLSAAAQRLALPLDLAAYDCGIHPDGRRPGSARILHQPLAMAAVPGRVDPANGRCVLGTLERAADGCLAGEFDAVMTLPVHKGVINDAGVAFSGHTEFLAERSGSAVLMLLVAGELRVALATTHLPLRSVPDAISPPRLAARLRLLHQGLRVDFGIPSPRIAVLGLNPHAGEGGHLGREEIEVITPTLARLREEGLDLDGPLSADTAFVPERRARYDAYFAMYHDQGLPVLKALGFGGGVNVSLGLPFVRTSVDHGVALDIAGQGRADAGSTLAAAQLALAISARRRS